MKHDTTLLTTDTPGHRQCVDHLEDGILVRWWPNTTGLANHGRVITLGIPILSKDILVGGPVWMNLHGGNPEYYRGLDSHWWAIYHRDWDNIITTLHWIDQGIDTGDICLQSAVPLTEDLYTSNMEVCANLIEIVSKLDWLPRRKQVQKGRYYSAMPESLKEVCRDKLRRKIGR